MNIRPNFDVREFVPPRVWNQFGRASRWFLDPRMLDLAQFYRDYFDAPVRVNDWHFGGADSASRSDSDQSSSHTQYEGDFTERGFRLPDSNVGARLSQHKFGRAFDCNVRGLTPDEVRSRIMDNEALFMAEGLTTLESGDIATTWVHSDVRTTDQNSIMIVTP